MAALVSGAYQPQPNEVAGAVGCGQERRHRGTAGLGRVGVNLVALGLALFAAAFITPERGFGRL